jgi:hypothetical protein
MTSRLTNAQNRAYQEGVLSLGIGSLSGVNHQSKTLRCLKALARRDGIEAAAAIVERKNPHTGKSSDLYGFGDVLVMTPDKTIMVQVCGSDWQSHIDKFRDEAARSIRLWLSCPNRELHMWGWRLLPKWKKDGSRSKTKVSSPKVQVITPGFLWGDEEAMMINPFTGEEF